MDKFSLSSADLFAFGLHKLSATVLLLGLLFLIVWVIQNVHKDKLKKLSITLIVLGVLGALLSGALFGGSYRGHKKFGYDSKDSSHTEVFVCLKDDACKSKLDAFLKGL